MNASPQPAPAISWRISLLLFLAVLILALPQAAILPLLDRDEPRFAEAAREMLQTGDYVVPRFNHFPRYDKPPLIYWCQVISYEIFGENAFAARLPSLLATAATAVLLYTWGLRLGSAQAGLGAGLSYAFCLQTIQQGRVATADALLIFFMTLTAFTGWLILRPKHAGRAPVTCYLVLALSLAGGFLAKGPEALLPLVPLVWCGRSAGSRVLIGLAASLLLGLAVVALWAIPAYIETNGDYWSRAWNSGIGQRYLEPLQDHGGSLFLWFPYYFLLFWISALPSSVLVLARFRKLVLPWSLDFADTYLLLNAALVFLVFTFMATKLPHYTLPAFPFLALFFARRWHSCGLSSGTFTGLGWITGVALAVVTFIAVPMALANHATPSPVGELVRAAGNALHPETEFAIVDQLEPNAIWEMRQVCRGYGHPVPAKDVAAFLDQPGPCAVLLTSALWQQLNLPADATRKTFEARGVNAAKLKSQPPSYLPLPAILDLTLVVKP